MESGPHKSPWTYRRISGMERQRSFVAVAVCLVCCIRWIEGASPVRSCPYGWVTVPGIPKCFSVSQDNAQKTWDDAQLNCIAQGGSLVTFQSQREMTYILGQLAQVRSRMKNYHHWWTGLKNGSYANGATFNASLFAGKWAPGQPVYNATNLCVQNQDGKFIVSSCQSSYQSVCERSQDLPMLCDTDDGWIFHNELCYKVATKSMPWDGARKACEAMGAQLAYVVDDATQASLTEMSRSNGHHFWIGLQLFSPTNWTWTNGTQLVKGGSSFWAPSQPGNIQGTKCVMIDHTLPKYTQNWGTSPCISPRYFACQDSIGTCPNGWRQVSDHCFRIYPQARLSFKSARALCEAQGGQLGMLKGPGDSRIVRSYMHEMHDVGAQQIWIGLTDANQNQGQWVWVKANGTVPKGPYTNWAGKTPTMTPNKQDCAFLNTADTFPKWHATSDCSRPMAVLCQVDVDAVIKPVTVPPSQLTCQKGWLGYNDTCFLLNEDDKTWLDARQWCQGQQADLARVPDSDTQAFLTSQLKNQGDYWIGLNDRSREGYYVWLDDSTNSTYYNWNPGEPNNAIQSNENCAAMMGTVGPPNLGKWHDISCGKRYNFICQKPPSQYITVGPSTTPVSFPVECGLFWELNPLTRACYQFNDDQLTWADALDVCRGHGGDLLSIASAQEQFYIAGRLASVQSDVVWIGATDSTNEGGWTWTDGTPFAYFDWDAGEPNDLHEEDCGAVIIAKGKWNDFQCMYRAGYVCKKMSTLTTPPPPVTGPPSMSSGTVLGCSPGWRGYRGWCYWYQDPGTAVSWSQAQIQCRQTRAELASVQDEAEHNFIFSLKPPGSKSMRAWIGLNDIAMEMSFQWSDGSPVTFTRWRFGEPNNYQGKDEDCVAISLFDGNLGWVDKACDDSGVASYVCKQPKTVVPAGNQLNTLGCTQGSEGFQGWCFTFVASAMTWQAAESNCQKLGGHLATSGRNYQVQMFLSAMLATRGGNYWVGLSDVTTPGNYTWSSGAKLPFTYWSSNHTGKETGTCVAMTTTPVPGRWQNLVCSQQQLSVCETPRQGFTTPSPALSTPPPVGTCPTGWVLYQSWCYMATNLTQSQRPTWMEARDTCQGYGGSLASIHDDQTNSFLVANVISNPGNYWIGLNDRDREASHEWVDDSPFQFSKWAQGQPDDLNNQEDCVAMQQADGTWWDNNCYIVLDFVCQIRPGTVIATTPPPPSVVTSPVCQGNGTWDFYNNQCYSLSPSDGDQSMLTWYDARRACMAQGADLVSISSPDESNYLLSLLNHGGADTAWVGLNDLGLSGYAWSDGSAVRFMDWRVGEPNDGLGSERCVEISHLGGWNDVPCTILGRYVCKKRPGAVQPITPSPTPLVQGGCPPGFTGIPTLNKCFYVSSTSVAKLNWTAARDACVGLGGYLATVSSRQEMKLLVSVLGQVLGQPSDVIWLGLSDLRVKGYFEWADNSEVAYTNWAQGEPNEVEENKAQKGPGGGVCALMYTGTNNAGLWHDRPCSWSRRYACHTSRRPSIPVETAATGGCRAGYLRFGPSCYKMDSTPRTWNQAQLSCQADSGYLAAIRNIYEEYFIDLHVGSNVAWIGLSDSDVDGVYQWTDQWPVQYTNWDKDEPSKGQGEGCVALTLQKHWNDTSCNDLHSSICEIDVVTVTPPPQTYVYGSCPDNTWVPYLNWCYHIEVAPVMTWADARTVCLQHGGDLASAHDVQQMFFIHSQVTPDTVDVWLGMSKAMGGGFQWSDGSAANFFSWGDGEPSDTDNGGHQDCVAFQASSGLWNDMDCRATRSYICQTPIIPYSQTPSQAAVVTNPVMTNRGPGVTTRGPRITPRGPTAPGRPVTRPAPFVTQAPQGQNRPPTQPWRPGPSGPLPTWPSAGQGTAAPSGGLSPGGVAGVVIVVVLVVAGMLVVGLLLYRRRRQTILASGEGFTNALYNPGQQSVAMGTESVS